MVDTSAEYIRGRYIKLYGAERTFTNLVKLLIEENFEDVCVLTNVLSWKHGPHPESFDPTGETWMRHNGKIKGEPVFDDFPKALVEDVMSKGMDLFICVKNPLAWYISYARYKKQSLAPINHGHLRSAFLKWNELYHNWASASVGCVKIWRYEDYLVDPETFLDHVELFYNLKRTRRSLWIPENKTIEGGQNANADTGLMKRTRFNASYYRNEKYLQYYTEDDLQVVAATIDWDLLNSIGYKDLRSSPSYLNEPELHEGSVRDIFDIRAAAEKLQGIATSLGSALPIGDESIHCLLQLSDLRDLHARLDQLAKDLGTLSLVKVDLKLP